MSNQNRQKWVKPRHCIVTRLAGLILYPYMKLKYHIKIDRLKEKPERQYLILLNHQTPFDQFFVGVSFKRAVYYVATEDIFSLGWVSSLIRWLVAPIPIKKQTTDIHAIKSCIQVASEGGTICIAPEGNRTYSGKTEYMSEGIASLARRLGLPIALYRIEGGYGAEPRWSDVVRKGKMHAYVGRIIEPEEYNALTNGELMVQIKEGLYVNEAVADSEYHHKERAQYLERAVYVCPNCGLAEFESHDHVISCKKCGLSAEYTPKKQLVGVGCDFPFEFVNDWYEYQKEYVRHLDHDEYIHKPMFVDRANVSEVIIRKKKNLLREDSEIKLYGNRIVLDEGTKNQLIMSFEDITVVACLGKNKANIYHKSGVYQLKGSKRFNALKYVNIFYHYVNISKGDKYGEFLGL